MKNFYLKLMLLCTLLHFNNLVFAQCPSLSPNSVTLNCSTPCATLSVTPIAVSYNQTTTYTVSSIPYAPAYPFTGGTAVTGLTDDVWASTVTVLPFKFCYFDHTYDKILIGSNGNVTFDSSLAGAYDPWSISGPVPGASAASGTATDNAIMFSWMDYLITSGGGINYAFYGTAPCRVMVVNYNNVSFFSCTGTHGTQQMVIYEGTNIIEMNSQVKPICAGWNSGYAVTGIENSCYCTLSSGGPVNYTAPGENGVAFTETNTAWRFTPSGTPSPWVYTWTGPAGVVGTGTSVVVCPTVTTVYTVSATSAACIGGVTVVGVSTVTVTSTTTPITGIPFMCLGYTTSLTDATPGGLWTSSNTAVATVNTTGIVTGVGGGTATISYSDAGCTSTMVVTVNTAPAITGTMSTCVGGTTTLTDAVTGGTWLSGNTGVATIGAASGIVTGASAGTSIITYTTPAGCTTTTTVTVVVLTPITGTMVVCQGSTVTLFDGGGGGVWTSGNLPVATIGAASGIVTGVSGGTATITYTGGGGCYITAVVTVNPLPAIPALASNSPICADSVLMLFATDATTGVTYKWTGPYGFASTLQNPTVPNAQSVNAGTYNVLITNAATGCTSNGSTSVIIKPTPAAPSPVNANSPCNGMGLNLTSNDLAGSTYSWTGPSAYVSTLQNPTINPAFIGVNDGTYTVVATLNGCQSLPATVVAIIKPIPPKPVTHDTSYCQFANWQVPLNYQVDSAIGSTLNWFLGTTPVSGADSPSTLIATYPGGTTWNVTQTVNGCTSPANTVTVTIVPTPQFSITYRNWVCQHDSIVLSYTLDPGSMVVTPTYNWILPVGATAVNGTNTTQSSVYVKFDSANVTYYDGSLIIGNLNGECPATESFSVRVVPAPIAYAYSKPDVCKDDTVGLAVTSKSSDAENFFWYIDGTAMSTSTAINTVAANSNSGGPYSITWNDTGAHIITILCTTHEGCQSLPTYDTIEVHQLPDATFDDSAIHSYLCIEDSVLFKAHSSEYNYTYLWQPEHSFNNNNKPRIWGKVEQEKSEIMLTVTDPFGCVSSYVKEIDPSSCCTVLFPNAFTPNGDGNNDFFHPYFEGYHNFHQFRIVNRWGQTIFESANSEPKWDGNYNGVPQDMGVYYYYIKYDCGGKVFEQKGDCTLVK